MAQKTIYYEDPPFIVFKQNSKRKIVVWNTEKPFENYDTGKKGHGHVKRIKTAKEAIIAVKYNKLIRDSNPFFLELCARLSLDKEYSLKCRQLALTKKRKGKQRYHRSPKSFLKSY